MMTVFPAVGLPSSNPGSLPRVLVVEDDRAQARLIELIFQRSEFKVDLQMVHTLAAARTVLAETSFDLVVTDFNLPDGRGLELLPADPAHAAFPVMLLTGQGDEKVAVQAMKSGAVDYIVKTPDSLSALPKTVATVLREWGHVMMRREMEAALQQKQLELEEKHHQLQELFQLVSLGKKEWELTIDCLSDLIIRIDADGRIRRVNRATAELTGRTYKELLGANVADVFGELPVGESAQGQIEMHHEASDRWFMVNIYNLDQTEIGPGSVITAHDFTTIRELNVRLEESNRLLGQKGGELELAYNELKSTQEMVLRQEKMATIGQLAAGVAHEINNPMGFILSNLNTLGGYLEKLTRYLQDQDQALLAMATPALAAKLEQARKAAKVDNILADLDSLISESLEGADRVKKIVADLKGASRYDQDHAELTDLNGLLDSTIPIIWNEIKYKSQLHRDYGDIPRTFCHPRQLSQVFTNLLVNAAQAIDRQGEITVRTWQDGECLCVSVSDNGAGIPEQIRQRIFDPFFTTKEVGKGTGLGLSISYEIVKNHGGEILVSSRPGAGATFTVRLPLVQLSSAVAESGLSEWWQNA